MSSCSHLRKAFARRQEAIVKQVASFTGAITCGSEYRRALSRLLAVLSEIGRDITGLASFE